MARMHGLTSLGVHLGFRPERVRRSAQGFLCRYRTALLLLSRAGPLPKAKTWFPITFPIGRNMRDMGNPRRI